MDQTWQILQPNHWSASCTCCMSLYFQSSQRRSPRCWWWLSQLEGKESQITLEIRRWQKNFVCWTDCKPLSNNAHNTPLSMYPVSMYINTLCLSPPTFSMRFSDLYCTLHISHISATWICTCLYVTTYDLVCFFLQLARLVKKTYGAWPPSKRPFVSQIFQLLHQLLTIIKIGHIAQHQSCCVICNGGFLGLGSDW